MVIISLGKDETSFKDNKFGGIYEAFIRRIVKMNEGIEIVVVAQSSVGNQQYYQTLKKLSDYYGLTYINMNDAFKISAKSVDTFTSDGYIPNEQGRKLYENQVISILAVKIEAVKPDKIELKPTLIKESDNFGYAERINTFQSVYGFDKQIEIDNRKYITENT